MFCFLQLIKSGMPAESHMGEIVFPRLQSTEEERKPAFNFRNSETDIALAKLGVIEADIAVWKTKFFKRNRFVRRKVNLRKNDTRYRVCSDSSIPGLSSLFP